MLVSGDSGGVGASAIGGVGLLANLEADNPALTGSEGGREGSEEGAGTEADGCPKVKLKAPGLNSKGLAVADKDDTFFLWPLAFCGS